ncbi:MAG TPA: TetR/AcrR family transcriptional regulator [Spirochaetia bacterium]|nr:TetR/AcrR family transcriptional regulator [Spirochaetia bacterium]
MPKAWSEREKGLVRKTLQTEGRKLFEKFGLQKTTIDDIVRAAHISKGAFYFFYPSKEMLYQEISEAIQGENRRKIYEKVFEPAVSRKEGFKAALRLALDLLTTTPLYRQLNTAEYEYLMRKLPEEMKAESMMSYIDEFIGNFSAWIEEGWMRKVDPLGLKGLFLSLFYLVIHREDFDEPGFNAAKELWIDMISEYLIAD